EDQSVVFGVLQAAPNSTLDQTKLYAQAVGDVYQALPEHKNVFQLTFPTGGFGGMVTKPWSERRKKTSKLMVEGGGAMTRMPRVLVIFCTLTPLPRGGNIPVVLVIASTAGQEQLATFANTLVQKAFASGLFMFADADLKFDQPQARVLFNRDKVRSQG